MSMRPETRLYTEQQTARCYSSGRVCGRHANVGVAYRPGMLQRCNLFSTEKASSNPTAA
jgi:uncharacterized protein (DUF169 family)